MLSREVNAFEQSESYTDLETRIASPKINPKATWLWSFKTSLFLHHLRYLSKVNCEHEIVQQCFDCSAADQRWAWGFSHSSSAHSPSPYESWLQSEFTLSPSPHRMIIHFNFTRLFFSSSVDLAIVKRSILFQLRLQFMPFAPLCQQLGIKCK